MKTCTAWDITWRGVNYQCLNCGATAEYAWLIKHKQEKKGKNYAI